MREMRLPARPSRSALMTGMPPATAASNASGTPARSGSGGEFRAMHRQQRLVGGDHGLARCDRRLHQRARRTLGAADQFDHDVGRGSAASATGSSYQRSPASDTPRSRDRSRAETAVTAIGRPARAVTMSALSRSSVSTPAPTVPRPATRDRERATWSCRHGVERRFGLVGPGPLEPD